MVDSLKALDPDRPIREADIPSGDGNSHIRRTRFTQVPIESRHKRQSFAREREGQMLIRRMLRAGAIGMGDPDGRQAQALEEGVVGQRAAGVWDDGGALVRAPLY